MFVTNLTDGSVLLPNGRDLVTWLEITEEEAIAWKFYDGNLFKISATQPLDLGEVKGKGFVIEDATSLGGVNTLAEAVKAVKDRNTTEAEVEAKREAEAIVDVPKSKKEKKVA